MAEARSWSRLAAEALPDEHRWKGGITARLFFAFNQLVAAQHEPTPAEMMKSRSKRVLPSRSSSPTTGRIRARSVRTIAYLAQVWREPAHHVTACFPMRPGGLHST